jgi:hypothetical protein
MPNTDLHDDEQHLLDLLVDDELSDDRRRELLSQFDGQPDGWRRCALAFLEAQGWRRNLRGLQRKSSSVGQSGPAPASNVAAPASHNRRRAMHWMGTVLAMAASFLAAFALALTWRVGPHPTGLPDAGTLANSPIAPGPGGAAPDVEALAAPSQRAVPAPTTPGTQVHFVTLSMPDAEGRPQQVEVPVVTAGSFDPAWFSGQPGAMPPELIHALRASGHRVRQQRELVPVDIEGGHVVIPVDQVEVQYIGHPYQ